MNSLKKLRDKKEFEGKIIENILEPYKHKKFEKPYVPAMLQDPQTNDRKWNKE